VLGEAEVGLDELVADGAIPRLVELAEALAEVLALGVVEAHRSTTRPGWGVVPCCLVRSLRSLTGAPSDGRMASAWWA
jgi:hypothetical protein